MERALITGGAGFIGSHIAQSLVGEGCDVRIIDNLSSGRLENLAGFGGQVTFVEGDIRDQQEVTRLADGCDVIFHQAAVVSVPYSIEHPQESHDVNIQGTLNVLQAARAAGVRRVVFACSAAVYGEDPRLPKLETMRVEPIAPYGIEKACGEQYCAVFSRHYGVETVSLRYFNVFGPRQDPSSPYSGVISIFVDRLLKGRAPLIFGDGGQCRDFVYVANVVQANLLAARVAAADGRVYNIGLGQRTTLNQLAAVLARATGAELAPDYAESRAGDIRDSVADISRARQELGYQPQVDVEQGLCALVDYERSRR